MKVLISGGTGLVGRALASELQSAGHACVVLSRSTEPVGLPDGVEVEQWDAKSTDALVPHVQRCDAVVHLAGESIGDGRWTAERKRRILDSRVDSTRAMAAALTSADPRPSVYLQASAVGYYGPRGDEEVAEDAQPGDDFLAQVCRAWEGASDSVDQLAVRRVLVRTGIVLSADGGALPKMALPFRLFAGGRAGHGRQWMPWIHLADEAGSMRFLLEHSTASGPFNLTAPEPVTNREFSSVLAKVLRRPNLMPAPAAALKVALGEMSTLILTGQRAVPRRLLEAGFTFRFPTLEPALRDLYG